MDRDRGRYQRRLDTIRLAARLRAMMWIAVFVGALMLFSHGPRRTHSSAKSLEWPDPVDTAGSDADSAFSPPALNVECPRGSSLPSTLAANVTEALGNSAWRSELTTPRITLRVFGMSLCEHSAAFMRNLLPVLRRHTSTVRVWLDFIGAGNSRYGFNSLHGSAGVVGDAYILCQEHITVGKARGAEAGHLTLLDFLSCVYEDGPAQVDLPDLKDNGATSFNRIEACVERSAAQIPDFETCVRTMRA